MYSPLKQGSRGNEMVKKCLDKGINNRERKEKGKRTSRILRRVIDS